jgi:hypothetical protein
MRKALIVLASLALVGGCAKRPDAIAPVAIPNEAYMSYSCERLKNELQSERNTLTALSSAQNSAATADAVGVFLVGVPISSLSDGDKEGLIAVSKGKIQAMDNVKSAKGC